MAEYIRNGTSEAIALWNPIDLGYVSSYMAHAMLTGAIKGEAGEIVNVGRMGEREIVADGSGGLEVLLGAPFVFDINNIDEWADVY
jgi:rhamnose transport system substrate-binding protein